MSIAHLRTKVNGMIRTGVLGRYVKYHGHTYVIVKQLDNESVQLYNPLRAGLPLKRSVLYSKLTPLDTWAYPVEYQGKPYLVTPKGLIISLVNGRSQSWEPGHPTPQAILAIAEELYSVNFS